MRKNVILLLVIAPFFSGCGTGINLNSPTATELCVEAHMAVRAAEKHLEGYNKKPHPDPDGREFEELKSAARAARAKANYYLLCLKASAGK